MPRNILAIGFSSDRTSFNSARFLGSYIIDSIVKRVYVCVCVRFPKTPIPRNSMFY